MFEYKIVQIARLKEEKTKEVISKKGKVETQTYTEVEPLEDFYARSEKTLNDFAKEGWQAINVNYSLPVRGVKEFIYSVNTNYIGYSVTDFNSAEFVFVLQRSK